MADAPADIKVRAELLGLYETAVLHGRLTEFEPMTQALEAAIRGHMALDSGLNRSNVGGWHSNTDMLDWGGPAAGQLAELAIRMAKRLSHFDGRDPAKVEWSTRMWANITPPGGLNMSHAHPGVLWAASYYVDMGDGSDGEVGGEFYFEDPRFPVPLMTMPGFRAIGIDGQPQQNERKLLTKRGDLVLFPGYLRHGVRPYNGTRERISIAMNIYAK